MQENQKEKQMMKYCGTCHIMEARHLSKPDRVRTVFHCNTNFSGACLNNKLLSGPDLTNQLGGVLLRFRSNKIAFVGEIEAMFYQVQVPDNQRGFSRYL